MHEWALAESIILTSINAVKKEGLTNITEINIDLGELQQINEEIFKYALKEIAESKQLDTAKIKMNINIITCRLFCKQCSHEWGFSDMKKKLTEDESESIHFIPEVAFVHTRCPGCGSPDFEIKTGRGISISSIKGEKGSYGAKN